MRINHVLDAGPSMATTRYRVIIPGVELSKRGHEVTMDDSPADAVNVYHKHFRREERDFIERTPGVMDVTDNHFGTQHREHYLHMLKHAAEVTCSSATLAEAIRAESGRHAAVIPDPWEFPEHAPHFGDGKRLLWFGHPSNIPSLYGIRFDCELEVVTAGAPEFGGMVTTTPYSRATLMDAAARADVCIIPFQDTDKDRCKSANRGINALRLGLFVCATPIPSYEELSEYVWLGDIMEGVRWARENPEDARAMVEAGQEYVAQAFAPEAVADEWEAALARVQL